MKTKILPLHRRAAAGAMFFLFTLNLLANPQGMTVISGSATPVINGSQLTVTAGNGANLSWQSFNIDSGEKTVFIQPSATSVVINRIDGGTASQIYGSLQANGIVVLLNSSGFYFGPNSYVSVAGLMVSTANCAPPQNPGGMWQFNGPPPLMPIRNFGQIKIGNGGSCFMIADQIDNEGTISAPGGTINLAAGKTVTLSERPDGRGMTMNVVLPQGSVDNVGNIIADGGTIALNAKVVNQNGFIQANSVKNVGGVIELVADDALSLGANSQISARGDDSLGGSAGGSVILKSGNTFSDADGSQIVTTGGAKGGNGGNIEVSAPNIQSINSTMDAGAQNGFSGGTFLLDPEYIVLGTSGTGVPDSSGTVAYNTPGTLNIDVTTAFLNKNFAQILLQATADITLSANTIWDLSGSTSKNSGQLILQAGGNITLEDGSKIVDAHNWSVSLAAGYDFIQNRVTPGPGSPATKGNILFDGSGAVQTAAGALNMIAGEDITIGSGYAITTGGGSINAHALAGNIDAGSDAQGYYFQTGAGSLSQAYSLLNSVGGISTAGGGDVNLTAGGNITTVLPISSGTGKIGYVYDGNLYTTLLNGGANTDFATAGSGAYGPQPGNVTVIAGGNVTGNYLVANGTGRIFAGVTMDANGNPVKDLAGNYILGTRGSAGLDNVRNALALSLITGGWNVTAAQDIILQEVSNPNGDFDVSGGTAYNHLFDYAPDAYVNLTAGNSVQLGTSGSSLPRMGTVQVPFIYPPILNIVAGGGGVDFIGDSTYNQLILFPSYPTSSPGVPTFVGLGSLTIKTTQNGALYSTLPALNGAPQTFNLIMSDSSLKQYKTAGNFGINDHSATPLYQNGETPVILNIAGNMNLMQLVVPEAAQITIGGNLVNSSFQGMNLSPNDVTSITVAGDINNRSLFTSVDLSQVAGMVAPDLSYLAQAVGSSPTAAQLASSFYYDKDTGILTYENITGKTLASVLQLLQNLTVQVLVNGVPQWTDETQTTPLTTTVSVLNSADAQALQAAYNLAGGPIPTGVTGYTIGGGGKFTISANNIDLGTSPGIQSKGVGYDKVGNSYPLAQSGGPQFVVGADITVNAAGNLNMYSSSIASLNGGNIYVNAAGDINVGSSDFSVNTSGARGIYSTAQGDVAVYAGGDINVNGSRIAAYDLRPVGSYGTTTPGGSVTVVSRNGNIDAGAGGSGFVIVSGSLVDPVTHNVTAVNLTVPGSGILDISYTVSGNILVEAPNGSVSASAGGITQLLLNNPVPPDTTLFTLPVDKRTLAEIYRLALKGQTQAALDLQDQMNGTLGTSQVSLYAGYELQKNDSFGHPLVDIYGNPVINADNVADGTLVKISDNQNIEALSSGVISAGSLAANATGDAKLNFFARNNVDINANNNIEAAGVGLGFVSVSSANGSVSGKIAGIDGISASGNSIDADLESNGTISGDTSGQKGLSEGTGANSVASAASANSDTDKVAAKSSGSEDDDDLKKKNKKISLAQKVSRVTVLLPKKD